MASCPISYDGTSYYRAHGVFPNLSKKIDLQIIKHQQRLGGWDWSDFIYADILFLQRPGTEEHLRLAEYCKNQLHRKLWIDYDDNFFVLPTSNRMYDAIDNKARDRMVKLIRMADVITVSTGSLKDFMIGVGARWVEVVPNALNPELVPPAKAFNHRLPKIPPNPKRQVYAWRGSDTHEGDFVAYLDALCEARQVISDKDVEWFYIGWKPWYLDDIGLKYTYIMPDDIFAYYGNLKRCRPEILHVVLKADEFNMHKSNIAWIEATAAGAVCIGPNFPEWLRPGILNYDSPAKYQELLVNPNDLPLADKWQESMDYINENLLLSKVNEQRADIIEKLMSNHKVELPIPQSMIE